MATFDARSMTAPDDALDDRRLTVNAVWSATGTASSVGLVHGQFGPPVWS
jgi:hypothetical protein